MKRRSWCYYACLESLVLFITMGLVTVAIELRSVRMSFSFTLIHTSLCFAKIIATQVMSRMFWLYFQRLEIVEVFNRVVDLISIWISNDFFHLGN